MAFLFFFFLFKWPFFYEMMVILGSFFFSLTFLLDKIVNLVLIPRFGGSGVE